MFFVQVVILFAIYSVTIYKTHDKIRPHWLQGVNVCTTAQVPQKQTSHRLPDPCTVLTVLLKSSRAVTLVFAGSITCMCFSA